LTPTIEHHVTGGFKQVWSDLSLLKRSGGPTLVAMHGAGSIGGLSIQMRALSKQLACWDAAHSASLHVLPTVYRV